MADSADRVELTELDVITRYSLAVRTATADRAELVAALRSDLEWLEGGRKPRATSTRATTSRRSATTPSRGGTGRAAKKAAPRRAGR